MIELGQTQIKFIYCCANTEIIDKVTYNTTVPAKSFCYSVICSIVISILLVSFSNLETVNIKLEINLFNTEKLLR